MTARQVFESTLIELSKIQAPSLKLYEFNYLFNKAINQYINKVYNVYDINQQTTDDLRVLKATAFLTPHKVELAGRNLSGCDKTDSAIQNTSAVTGNSAQVNGSTSGGYKHLTYAQYIAGLAEGATPLSKVEFDAKDAAGEAPAWQFVAGGTGTGYTGQATSYLSKAHRSIQSLHGATYEVFLPIDYLHMLNCVCIYYVAKTKDCWDAGSYIEVPATRLTADSWSSIITDIYNRPSPMRPYYYIHNVNQQQVLPTDPRTEVEINTGGGAYQQPIGIDMATYPYKVTHADGGEGYDDVNTNDGACSEDIEAQNSNFQRTYTFKVGETTSKISLVEKPSAVRIGNTSNVRCEIRYGKDDSLFQLAEVQVDYVKCPQFIRLTQEQIDLTEDTSQIMEFPDYVNQEIINELVHLVMERVNDPRLSNNMQMTQSIARPTGQQAQPQQTTQAQA